MKFGLIKEHWEFIEKKLITPLKENKAKVWVFGSRARGDNKKFSDLDILYESTIPIKNSLIGTLKEHLEESLLPIKVDIVDIDDLASSYKENVLRERIEI